MRAAGNKAYCFTDGRNLFVDASDPLNSGKARYMNYNHVDPNVVMKRIIHNSISRIAFKTTRDVPKDEELLRLRGHVSAMESGAIPRHRYANAIAIASTASVAARIVRSGEPCHQ